MSMCECRCQRGAEEAIGSPRAGGCEPSGQGDGNWTLVLTTELSLQAPVTLDGNSVRMSVLQCTSGTKADQYQAAQFSFLEQSLRIWALPVPPCSLSLTCHLLPFFSLLSTPLLICPSQCLGSELASKGHFPLHPPQLLLCRPIKGILGVLSGTIDFI